MEKSILDIKHLRFRVAVYSELYRKAALLSADLEVCYACFDAWFVFGGGFPCMQVLHDGCLCGRVSMLGGGIGVMVPAYFINSTRLTLFQLRPPGSCFRLSKNCLKFCHLTQTLLPSSTSLFPSQKLLQS